MFEVEIEIMFADDDEKIMYDPIFNFDDFCDAMDFIKVCLKNGYSCIVSKNVEKETAQNG